MANYVGEGLTILCAATDPATGNPITTATAEVEFFAPGKNPVANPDDRTADEGPFPMGYSATVVNKDGSFKYFRLVISGVNVHYHIVIEDQTPGDAKPKHKKKGK